ncbi:MAG TPA: response regulator [Chloroflexia bacterium]|nr:response regulator [Chloroflexia bacterium]
MAKILIADDSPTQVATLANCFTGKDHQVEIVGSGLDALEQTLAESYDLLILDLNLPDMSGLDVCTHYKGKGGQGTVMLVTSRDCLNSLEPPVEAFAPDLYCEKNFKAIEMRVETFLLRLRRKQRIGLTEIK